MRAGLERALHAPGGVGDGPLGLVFEQLKARSGIGDAAKSAFHAAFGGLHLLLDLVDPAGDAGRVRSQRVADNRIEIAGDMIDALRNPADLLVEEVVEFGLLAGGGGVALSDSFSEASERRFQRLEGADRLTGVAAARFDRIDPGAQSRLRRLNVGHRPGDALQAGKLGTVADVELAHNAENRLVDAGDGAGRSGLRRLDALGEKVDFGRHPAHFVRRSVAGVEVRHLDAINADGFLLEKQGIEILAERDAPLQGLLTRSRPGTGVDALDAPRSLRHWPPAAPNRIATRLSQSFARCQLGMGRLTGH